MFSETSVGHIDADFDEMQVHSMELYTHAFLGSCSGGFSPQNKDLEKNHPYYKAVCSALEGKPEQEIFCGSEIMTKLLKPTAWASYLEKGIDIVLAFTGTQMHKKEMF